MSEAVHPSHFSQENQWLSFNAGKDSVAPNAGDFAVHVLTGDTFMYEISGGFVEAQQESFVSAPVVYPTSEYWETLLNSTRIRPFIDLSISKNNTLRIPMSMHEYDLYADTGKFYEDVEIDGQLRIGPMKLGGATEDIVIEGKLKSNAVETESITSVSITSETIKDAVLNTRVAIKEITTDYTLAKEDTGSIFHAKPATGNINITLPYTLPVGTSFTLTNLLAGKTTTFPAGLKARGNVLSEVYSAATIYFDGTDWYGFGDLV